ncbi:hypothetical protein PT285_02565 [Lactobacillus sp. ESL0791]|uniref:hypothetical protein n=1 Tax=Lactobacillus sp. ESL0791 TaxID=2983234 RepID=UPI0023F857A7|nr:hypothetical protein [Lactobacillus sp. ESL0791]MDF7638317.1 hypothetical protein [Lactobacillus sp. ESL0791]
MQEVINYLKSEKLKFSLVSMDCTVQVRPTIKVHMNWFEDLKFKSELIENKLADEKTIFVANHFSHNGGKTYQEMSELSSRYQIVTSYDGLELNF